MLSAGPTFWSPCVTVSQCLYLARMGRSPIQSEVGNGQEAPQGFAVYIVARRRGCRPTEVAGSSRKMLPEVELLDAYSRAVITVVDTVGPSVVGDFGKESPAAARCRNNTGAGSGTIIAPDGYILTNDHVVQGSDLTVGYPSGWSHPGGDPGRHRSGHGPGRSAC